MKVFADELPIFSCRVDNLSLVEMSGQFSKDPLCISTDPIFSEHNIVLLNYTEYSQTSLTAAQPSV